MKPILLTKHALRYTKKRGFTPAEVEEAIGQAPWQKAKKGRMECRQSFPYNAEWNGRWGATKQVRAIFLEEELQIVVVTVITYYF